MADIEGTITLLPNIQTRNHYLLQTKTVLDKINSWVHLYA